MKKWLVSGAVREVAPIKKKRKDLEEQARIQRIDDQADSLLLDYGYKMDKFVLETMQTMQPYLEAAAIINNSDPPGTVATSPPSSDVVAGITDTMIGTDMDLVPSSSHTDMDLVDSSSHVPPSLLRARIRRSKRMWIRFPRRRTHQRMFFQVPRQSPIPGSRIRAPHPRIWS